MDESMIKKLTASEEWLTKAMNHSHNADPGRAQACIDHAYTLAWECGQIISETRQKVNVLHPEFVELDFTSDLGLVLGFELCLPAVRQGFGLCHSLRQAAHQVSVLQCGPMRNLRRVWVRTRRAAR